MADVKGLKALRGENARGAKGPSHDCSNCGCKRYTHCGCQKSEKKSKKG